MNPPKVAIVAVTYKCNARCKICDIWKNPPNYPELTPKDYRNLPKNLVDVNITGGEPFIREDLVELIYETHRVSSPRFVISSNGSLTEKTIDDMKQILRFSKNAAVRISIDGMRETHDDIRGVPGFFDKAVRTVEGLKSTGVRDLGIAMTVIDQNIPEISSVYELANELGVEFSISVATDSDIYFGKGKSELLSNRDERLSYQFNHLIHSEMTSWNIKRIFRGWFEKGLLEYALGTGKDWKCDAARGFFYLDPKGNVYPCHILPMPIGNIKDTPWEDIWNSDKAKRARVMVDNCKNGCWMICTIKSKINKKMPEIALEIAKLKAKAHLHKSIV
ncbi:MAG: hypothetical protein B6D65_05980 [candidate division Zixibacteria bacterium 4484_93]|nr:MAG: hypothetical protein B6D65_05980 [candidate division Zixibacteria bacterium 4484_93]